MENAVKTQNKYQVSIDLLNDAVGKEIATSLQYMYFHTHFEDDRYQYLSKIMREISIAEMRHIEEFSDRILFLQGDFRRVVEGVNETLDAVIGPLNVAANYVDRISKGDIPEKITDSYNGDFNTIKNNLNTCIDAVNKLVADARALSIAAVEGRQIRIEPRSEQGASCLKNLNFPPPN